MNARASAIIEEKRKLRKQFRAYRAGLSASEYERLSRLIASRVLDLPLIQKSNLVHIYWPMIEHREIDTRSIIEEMRHRGIMPVLPVITDFDAENPAVPRMKHLVWDGTSELRKNQWGVCEPQRGRVVPLDELDAIVVPALGGGRNGHRIGHGFGYYDEFLPETNAVTIGLVYAECLVESVPNEPHDVPLDVIITENVVLSRTPL